MLLTISKVICFKKVAMLGILTPISLKNVNVYEVNIITEYNIIFFKFLLLSIGIKSINIKEM
ncbi:hypothetical protein [Caloramator quimbayensis]|uniref:hypothetical protein n=1 Tax=Caloramator quimbayensis TaxID=1147123 RepID=UPI0015C4C7AC|nr:hypothetical protein [Caloramator quimbayensis]